MVFMYPAVVELVAWDSELDSEFDREERTPSSIIFLLLFEQPKHSSIPTVAGKHGGIW
jgi:hypothetical protein